MGWFPLLTMIPVRSQWGRSEVVIIYPDTMAMLNNQRVISATHPRTHANEARREDAARSRCKDCANPGRKGHRSLIDFFHRFTNEIAEKTWFMIWLIWYDMIWYEKPRKIMIYQNHGVYIELIMCIIYDVCMISTYVYIYIILYITMIY